MKRLTRGTIFIVTAFIVALILTPTPARAETTNCTAITSLPAVICTQGVYCLTGHLSTTLAASNAITINANNVVIDLNGFKLGGLGAGAGTNSQGIYANQRKNITIRNGSIRGFRYGILLNDGSPYVTSSGHLVEDIVADGNTNYGIIIYGIGNMVHNNRIINTGGSTNSNDAFGIRARGSGTRILNNDVTNVTARSNGFAFGIELQASNGAVVEGNRINDVSSNNFGAYGIYNFNSNNVVIEANRVSDVVSTNYNDYGVNVKLSSNVTVSNNRIAGVPDNGVYFSIGGKYRDNIVSGATTPYTNGTDAGNNN